MEERVIALEMQVAYQENQIDEMNKVLYRQQEQLDRLINTVVKLHEKYEAISSLVVGEIGEEAPPPHY